jgi:phosphonate transport system substrate-binding protein
VQGGAADAGALSEAVWQKALSSGKVDESQIGLFYVTPPYFDYNWTIRPDVEEKFGDGFMDLATDAILRMDETDLLELFSAEKFIASENGNYAEIENVARALGILK